MHCSARLTDQPMTYLALCAHMPHLLVRLISRVPLSSLAPPPSQLTPTKPPALPLTFSTACLQLFLFHQQLLHHVHSYHWRQHRHQHPDGRVSVCVLPAHPTRCEPQRQGPGQADPIWDRLAGIDCAWEWICSSPRCAMCSMLQQRLTTVRPCALLADGVAAPGSTRCTCMLLHTRPSLGCAFALSTVAYLRPLQLAGPCCPPHKCSCPSLLLPAGVVIYCGLGGLKAAFISS